MNNNTFAVESFVSFCDDMMIAEESVFSTIKSKLISLFTKLVLFLDRKVKGMKDGKVKRTLQSLLDRAKRGLSKSKTLNDNNPELAQELQQEASEIKMEAEKVDDGYTDIQLQQGKALYIDSRTFNSDFLGFGLFGPNLPKPILREIRDELYEKITKSNTGSFKEESLHFSIKTKSGYYATGIDGILGIIYKEAGLNVEEHFYRDRVGRKCAVTMCYITTDPSVTFNNADVELVYEKLKSVWDLPKHEVKRIETPFK